MKPKRQKKLRLNVDVDTQDQKGEPLHIPASSEVFRASALAANDWLQTIYADGEDRYVPQSEPVMTLYHLFRFGYVISPFLETFIDLRSEQVRQISDTSCELYAAPGSKSAYVKYLIESNHPTLFWAQKALVLYADDMALEGVDNFVFGVSI